MPAAGRRALEDSPAAYGLLVPEWSLLHYHRHSRKADQLLFSQGSDRGYERASALLVDAATGDPVAPLALRLRTAAAVQSTRAPVPRRAAHHRDEVLPTMPAAAALALPRRLVHVLDCAGDAVAHLRRWHQHGPWFLVRTDGTRAICWRGLEGRLPAVVAAPPPQAVGVAREVSFHGRPAVQTVAAAPVVLTRPAYRHRRGKRAVLPGQPLPLRLVVSQVRDAAGRLLAQWCLLTTLPPEVTAKRVALWYYWRWRIESFFKLLKGAGQQVAAWQPASGEALAKRLVVARMACVVVGQGARLEGAAGERGRGLLGRLSGRQMKRGLPFPQPALRAGLWVLRAMTEVLAPYDLDEIQRLASAVLPNLAQPDSS